MKKLMSEVRSSIFIIETSAPKPAYHSKSNIRYHSGLYFDNIFLENNCSNGDAGDQVLLCKQKLTMLLMSQVRSSIFIIEILAPKARRLYTSHN
jgi:hypothetical protein